jgi:uncharacterized protein (TIGR03067 family)
MRLALCLLAVPAAKGAEAETDLQRLEGFWKIESIERSHEEPDDRSARQFEDFCTAFAVVRVEGNRIVSPWLELVGGEVGLRPDPLKSPKEMEIEVHVPAFEKWETVSGTYSLEDDRVSVRCTAGSEQFLLILKRLAADSHEARLQGFWKLVSLRFRGSEVDVKSLIAATDKEGGSPMLMVIGKFLGLFPSGAAPIGNPKGLNGKFRLGPEKEPKEIRVTGTQPEDSPPQWLGIYALEGDTLRICGPDPFDPPKDDPPRPPQMAAEEGDGQVLFTFQRMGPEEVPKLNGLSQNPYREADAQNRLNWIRKTYSGHRVSRAKALKRLIRDFPGTKAAKEAERLLGPDADDWKSPREWTIDGEEKVQAAFAGAIGQEVRLRTPDGRLIKTTIDRLSDADREWLERLRRAR